MIKAARMIEIKSWNRTVIKLFCCWQFYIANFFLSLWTTQKKYRYNVIFFILLAMRITHYISITQLSEWERMKKWNEIKNWGSGVSSFDVILFIYRRSSIKRHLAKRERWSRIHDWRDGRFFCLKFINSWARNR